jgi:hypothetical protein
LNLSRYSLTLIVIQIVLGKKKRKCINLGSVKLEAQCAEPVSLNFHSALRKLINCINEHGKKSGHCTNDFNLWITKC